MDPVSKYLGPGIVLEATRHIESFMMKDRPVDCGTFRH